MSKAVYGQYGQFGQFGYGQNCTAWKPRDFHGTPLVADDGKTCVYLSQGAKSVCNDVMHPPHRAICSCKAKAGKNDECKRIYFRMIEYWINQRYIDDFNLLQYLINK